MKSIQKISIIFNNLFSIQKNLEIIQWIDSDLQNQKTKSVVDKTKKATNLLIEEKTEAIQNNLIARRHLANLIDDLSEIPHDEIIEGVRLGIQNNANSNCDPDDNYPLLGVELLSKELTQKGNEIILRWYLTFVVDRFKAMQESAYPINLRKNAYAKDLMILLVSAMQNNSSDAVGIIGSVMKLEFNFNKTQITNALAPHSSKLTESEFDTLLIDLNVDETYQGLVNSKGNLTTGYPNNGFFDQDDFGNSSFTKTPFYTCKVK